MRLELARVEEVGDHFSPKAATVGSTVPVVQAVPDAFVPKDLAEVLVVFSKGVVITDDECDLHLAEGGDPVLALQSRKEVGGGIEEDLVAVVAVEEVPEVVDLEGEVVASGEGDKLLETLGVAEGDVCGVEGAEAAAMRDGRLVWVLQLHQREDLLEDVVFVVEVALDSPMGMGPPAVEAFGVDAIDAVELKFSRFDSFSRLLDQPKVFVLEEATPACWKNQYTCTSVSKNKQLHVSPEAWAPPFMIFAIHRLWRISQAGLGKFEEGVKFS